MPDIPFFNAVILSSLTFRCSNLEIAWFSIFTVFELCIKISIAISWAM